MAGLKEGEGVRFIVRAHYYKHPNGNVEVPGKGKCFLRQAYVKGPRRGPWKTTSV